MSRGGESCSEQSVPSTRGLDFALLQLPLLLPRVLRLSDCSQGALVSRSLAVPSPSWAVWLAAQYLFWGCAPWLGGSAYVLTRGVFSCPGS